MDLYMMDFSISAKRPNVDDVKEVDDVEEGNPNPTLVIIDVVDIVEEDDMVANMDNIGDKSVKRKLPPQPKDNGPKEPNKKVKEDEDEYVKDKKKAPCWEHFIEIKDEKNMTQEAQCKYCKTIYKANPKKHGVTNLNTHMTKCKKFPNRDKGGQQNISFKPTVDGVEVVSSVFSFDDWKDVGINMESRVKAILVRLYDAYASDSQFRIQVCSASETSSVRVEEDCDYQSSLHSEFDTYLEEEYSSVYESELDNTGGRILDPFRSSLLPSMVETLICTQNWLLHTVPINLRQAMDKVEDLEREILQPDDASSEVRSDRSNGIRID
ncbi:hypothetical protein Acr_07g0016960 [Actinidia rufa]|uniref:BED-type domain-containing protein n=1 Tax=Actinidia rufa TaxID=165716 RepID=A0A7J0EYJ9_9ERIC|nr:hypothetical protein Acr_07g0016960 [Actinidia rufa]